MLDLAPSPRVPAARVDRSSPHCSPFPCGNGRSCTCRSRAGGAIYPVGWTGGREQSNCQRAANGGMRKLLRSSRPIRSATATAGPGQRLCLDNRRSERGVPG